MFQRGPTIQRTDKSGRVWEIERADYGDAVIWDARAASVTGRYTASVTVTDGLGAFRPMAVLDDIRVDRRMEDQGVGSMLLGEVIEVCRERGHAGIEGQLSRTDSRRFDKLKHFYEKFDFTVTFHSPEHPQYDRRWPGETRLVF